VVEKEGKVIDVMKNIILLKNVWLKMNRRLRKRKIMWIKQRLNHYLHYENVVKMEKNSN
jgi:hypothetical protein